MQNKKIPPFLSIKIFEPALQPPTTMLILSPPHIHKNINTHDNTTTHDKKRKRNSLNNATITTATSTGDEEKEDVFCFLSETFSFPISTTAKMDAALEQLYAGLMLLAAKLGVMDSSVASNVQSSAAAVAWAAETLSVYSAIANMRAWAVVNSLPPSMQKEMLALQVNKKSLCVFVAYNQLLRARQTVRNNNNTSLSVTNTSTSSVAAAQQQAAIISFQYSRLGDVLTFFDNQHEMARCVEAHRIVEAGYNIINQVIPNCLFFRHNEPLHFNCGCGFVSRYTWS